MTGEVLDLTRTEFGSLEVLVPIRQYWALPPDLRTKIDGEERIADMAQKLHGMMSLMRDSWAQEACKNYPEVLPSVRAALGEYLPNVILHGHLPIIRRQPLTEEVTRFHTLDFADSDYFDSRVEEYIFEGERVLMHTGKVIIENALGKGNYLVYHKGDTFEASLRVAPRELANRLK